MTCLNVQTTKPLNQREMFLSIEKNKINTAQLWTAQLHG